MKAFIAAAMVAATEAITLGEADHHHSTETTYYEDYTFMESEPIFFHREVPVKIIEKYYHAHSGASDSSDRDSYESDLSSFYSDECPPGNYDCTDSSDYSDHSSDDSGSVESHDHDHGYYGYDYFDSNSEHYDDLHAHHRETWRHEKLPEVYQSRKLTYVKVPKKKSYEEEEEVKVELAYGHDPDLLVEVKPDPWPGTDPYPNQGKFVGAEYARYEPRDGVFAP